MTIEQIKRDIQNAEANLAEAKAKLAEIENEGHCWKPAFHEVYYFIDDTKCLENEWDGSETDKERYRIGNAFRTRKEAERELKRRIVTNKLRRIAAKYPKCDWNNYQQIKYCLRYRHETKEWIGELLRWTSYHMPGIIYCPGPNYITEALALGDELNVLLEG